MDLTVSLYTGGSMTLGAGPRPRVVVLLAPASREDVSYRNAIQELAAEHHEHVEFVVVADDLHARELDRQLDLSLIIAYDPQFAVAAKLGIERLPSALLVDQHGRVTDIVPGDDEPARAKLRAALP